MLPGVGKEWCQNKQEGTQHRTEAGYSHRNRTIRRISAIIYEWWWGKQ